MKRTLMTAFLVPVAGVSLASCGVNSIPTAEEEAKAKWADVQAAYQRRANLIPNLVATTQGAASSEQRILVGVTEARANASRRRRAGSAPRSSRSSAFRKLIPTSRARRISRP
jgi:LemA protein